MPEKTMQARERLDLKPEEEDRASARAARILLAEDDTEMRSLLAWGLEEEGYQVVEAENGLELLQHLQPSLVNAAGASKEPPFDLILSDIRMPGLSGLEVLTAYRRRDKKTPFVLITAFGDIVTHGEARILGASAVMDKPFDIDDLRLLLRRILPANRVSRKPPTIHRAVALILPMPGGTMLSSRPCTFRTQTRELHRHLRDRKSSSRMSPRASRRLNSLCQL